MVERLRPGELEARRRVKSSGYVVAVDVSADGLSENAIYPKEDVTKRVRDFFDKSDNA